MIRFECPGCQARYTVPPDKAGKVTRCSRCRAKFFVPTPPPPPPTPVPEFVETSFPEPQAFVTQVEETDIEIAPCPGCEARLMVSAAELGNEVECPYCQAVYRAETASARRVVEQKPAELPFAQLADDPPRRRRRRDVEDDEDDEPPVRKRSGGRRKPAKRRSEGNWFYPTLGGIAALSVLLVFLGLFFWPFLLVLYLLWIIPLFGSNVWFLVIAFQESTTEGLLNLFVPFYSLYYLITRFEDVKKPFYVQLTGSFFILLAIAAFALQGVIR